ESSATGLIAGINLSRMLRGEEPVIPPPVTMIGALYRYLREADPKHFQPMNANFGLVDELETPVKDKRLKREKIAERALEAIERWAGSAGIPVNVTTRESTAAAVNASPGRCSLAIAARLTPQKGDQ